MKRITYLALAIVLCFAAFGVVGCGDKYVEVQSITYSVGGETTTLTSTFEIILENKEHKEYEQNYKIYFSPQDIAVDKSNIKENEIPQNKGDIIYTVNIVSGYFKGNFSHIEYNYVLFKKIDEKTIRIKYDGKEFEVMTDSYQVTYFN